jgi:hypothetical protein
MTSGSLSLPAPQSEPLSGSLPSLPLAPVVAHTAQHGVISRLITVVVIIMQSVLFA